MIVLTKSDVDWPATVFERRTSHVVASNNQSESFQTDDIGVGRATVQDLLLG